MIKFSDKPTFGRVVQVVGGKGRKGVFGGCLHNDKIVIKMNFRNILMGLGALVTQAARNKKEAEKNNKNGFFYI